MTFPYEELAEAGIKRVVIDYSGEGDEGYINDIIATSDIEGQFGVELEYGVGLYDIIRDEAYDLLEREYAGWEINEGATGEITLIVSEQKAYLHHGTIVHNVHYEDKEFS